MEISFILTYDELFTLATAATELSQAGEHFLRDALPDAQKCSLDGLVDKKMAHYVGDKIELSPVIRMIADAIAKADTVVLSNGNWIIQSSWIKLKCEKYPFQDNCFKVVPLKEK